MLLSANYSSSSACRIKQKLRAEHSGGINSSVQLESPIRFVKVLLRANQKNATNNNFDKNEGNKAEHEQNEKIP